jgi:hypothetical protein
MTEQPKLFGLSEEHLNAYLEAISQQKTICQQKKKPEDKPPENFVVKPKNKSPEYFYDISTNLFIG